MASALTATASLYPSTLDPDYSLVERAKRGDQQAFRSLFERHAPRVRRIVSRYINEADEVSDLVQEVFARAFHALRSFDGRSRFFTWLYRIAVNQSIEGLARQRRQRMFESSGTLPDAQRNDEFLLSDETPDEALAAKQVAYTVQRAVEDLSPDYRVALQLREIDGLTYEEIGMKLGIPLGTVRTRIFRGREAVAKALVPVRMHRTSGRF